MFLKIDSYIATFILPWYKCNNTRIKFWLNGDTQKKKVFSVQVRGHAVSHVWLEKRKFVSEHRPVI